MKSEIRKQVNRYRGFWERQEGYDSAVSEDGMKKGFFVRHHSFARSDIQEKSWFSEYTDEMYDSVLDCLAYYRWYIIPGKLREASGLREETDLELLLDSAGYSASLIAEELFCMIDKCLESGCCSENDLHRIRLAYNGLSGFKDTFVCRIVQWGDITNHIQNPFREDMYSGYIRTPSLPSSVTSVAGVFAG
ncbi:MAG: hypothetical protein GQ565_13695 [Candidatus Aegiribacteria sp.]|nr:hypothetical protein [Candidatus Aegiribacteria sp.]